ncbi:hypothetical protein [uncultured Muribaculum sp.]|uniref:hypothetical protein n=1 Tax=uncultured Muribaculum sp. TaxID=1918613 RepID=UPI0025B27D9D|nr:hypothetical protein [uncultured Muribaculum sp.]
MYKNSTNPCAPVSLACARGSQSLKKAASNIADYAEVSEKAIEKYLIEQAEANGLLCLKYSNPNMVGYPDRLLVLPGGSVVWVELKSNGRKPTKIQQIRIAGLRNRGHYVWVIDNRKSVDNLMEKYREWIETHKEHLTKRGVYELAKNGLA